MRLAEQHLSDLAMLTKSSALAQRAIDHPHHRPTAGEILVDHDDIDRHAQTGEFTPPPHRLLCRVRYLGLDHENVEVRLPIAVTARARPEQHDTRAIRRSSGQPAADLLDQIGLGHP